MSLRAEPPKHCSDSCGGERHHKMRICFIVGLSANPRLRRKRQTKRVPGGGLSRWARGGMTTPLLSLQKKLFKKTHPSSEKPRFPFQDPVPLPNKSQMTLPTPSALGFTLSSEDFKKRCWGLGTCDSSVAQGSMLLVLSPPGVIKENILTATHKLAFYSFFFLSTFFFSLLPRNRSRKTNCKARHRS